MISAVIVNYNQSEKLIKCIQSVRGLADEILVIDLESDDDSVEMVRKEGARVISHQRVEYVELIRDFSISQSKGEWILILDPDEIVKEKLKDKLKVLTGQSDYVAINIPRKNIFFDKWISHTNWWPDRHIRFFKKDAVRWDKKIHSYPIVNGQVLNLPQDEKLAIEHFGYDNIADFIKRQNKYSSIDAKNRFDKGIRFNWALFLWWPTREFLARFIKHKGFLDGLIGFFLTFLMMFYQLSVAIKLWEMEKSEQLKIK